MTGRRGGAGGRRRPRPTSLTPLDDPPEAVVVKSLPLPLPISGRIPQLPDVSPSLSGAEAAFLLRHGSPFAQQRELGGLPQQSGSREFGGPGPGPGPRRKLRQPSHGELWHATIMIQRFWRSYAARVFVWRIGGPGTHYMARRLQCWARQINARRDVFTRFEARQELCAAIIAGLYRGFKGREKARRARIAIYSKAASAVQRIYRGRMGMRWFRLFRAMVREAKARFLQRCFRGHRGRVAANRVRSLLDASIEELTRLGNGYLTGELRNRVDKLLDDGSSHADEQRHRGDAVVRPIRLSAEDQVWLLRAALGITVVVHDYRLALRIVQDLLRLAHGSPEGASPQLLYTYSILLQLLWSRFGFYGIVEHTALDEALLCCERAWWLDSRRLSRELPTDSGGSVFEEYEIGYFRAAYEMALRKPQGIASAQDAQTCRNLAVCYHTVYGAFVKGKGGRQAAGSLQWKTSDSYRRVRQLYTKALSIETGGTDVTLSEAAGVFENVFSAVWRPCASEERTLPRIRAGSGRSGTVDSEKRGIRAQVVMYKCGKKCVIRASRRFMARDKDDETDKPNALDYPDKDDGGDVRPQGGVMCVGFVLHEVELQNIWTRATEFFLDQGRAESTVRSQERTSLVGEFVLPRLRLVPNTSCVLASPSVPLPRVKEADSLRDAVHRKLRAQRAALRKKMGRDALPVAWAPASTDAQTTGPLAGDEEDSGDLAAASNGGSRSVTSPRSTAALELEKHLKEMQQRAAEVRWYSAKLPALSTMRDAVNHITIKQQAAHRLQNAYRGFQSRALWKRLQHRMMTKATQAKHLDMRRRANEGRREFEKRMAAALQSRFKGWLWRVRLRRMGEASVVAQTLYRGYAARRLREAEERRRLEGLPVYEVYQRGMTVSGVPLIVTVKKCGLSYKFIGHDLEQCTTYYGYVYATQTMDILDATQPKPATEEEIAKDPNARFRVIDPIKPWQNERLLELLLSMLSLTEPIGALTSELTNLDKNKTLVVHPTLGSRVNGPPIQRVAGLKRTLQDQYKTTAKYEKILDKANRKKANAPVGRGRASNQGASSSGKLIGMAEPGQRNNGGDRIVDIPQFRRMVRVLRPDFRIDNLKYHREEESPRTARARRNAGRVSSSTRRKPSGKSKAQADREAADLDSLFDRKMKSSAFS